LFFPDLHWCREAGAKAHFLPYGADLSVHGPRELSSREQEIWGSDVVLVGIMTPARAEILRRLVAAGIKVALWGACTYTWTRALSRQIPPDLRSCLRGGVVSPETAARIYNAGRVVLNIHSAQFSENGINNRTFEVGATGAFQLLNYRPRLSTHNQGVDRLIAYSSPADLPRLVAHYLEREQERREIGQAFARDVRAYHTYDHRILDLLDKVGARFADPFPQS
jgi:spore maturation protein CgeB